MNGRLSLQPTGSLDVDVRVTGVDTGAEGTGPLGEADEGWVPGDPRKATGGGTGVGNLCRTVTPDSNRGEARE